MGTGPEDVAVDQEGRIYTGVEDGRIWRFHPYVGRLEVFCRTGGRPLGMAFDIHGNLLVADAQKGLLSISADGVITVLSTTAGGIPVGLADDLDIAANGTIYFSDASNRFSQDELMLDLLDHRPHGRLLVYDPDSGSTRVALGGLYFANGVAVSPDQSFVLVCETWKYRVRRLWLAGPHKGRSDLFIDNLPGFPDNIASNGKGIFWVALVQGPESRRTLDPLLPRPFLRKILLRMPPSLRPGPTAVGYVLGLDMEGNVVHNMQDPTGEVYGEITSATEHEGMLYLGSLRESALGRLPVP